MHIQYIQICININMHYILNMQLFNLYMHIIIPTTCQTLPDGGDMK